MSARMSNATVRSSPLTTRRRPAFSVTSMRPSGVHAKAVGDGAETTRVSLKAGSREEGVSPTALEAVTDAVGAPDGRAPVAGAAAHEETPMTTDTVSAAHAFMALPRVDQEAGSRQKPRRSSLSRTCS